MIIHARHHALRARRAGFTLIETLIASTILATVMLASYGLLHHDTRLTQSSLGISVAEMRAQSMLFGIERELADSNGAKPVAQLTQSLGAGSTAEIRVDSTLGFPPQGILLLDRGTNHVERLHYDSITATTFRGLARGEQGTGAFDHATGGELLWNGLADPISLQVNPAPNLYDGQVQASGRTLYFRGDGAGFSYRVPTDPAGGNNLLDGNNLRWGAGVRNTPLASGWIALEFVPKDTFDEARTGTDINRDGDSTDVFDVGQLRRRTWNTDAPDAGGDDAGLGPSVVLQERGHWGSDLDHDGFSDPLFLWDATRREVTIRLFILGRGLVDEPVVRRVETTIFLRNVPQT